MIFSYFLLLERGARPVVMAPKLNTLQPDAFLIFNMDAMNLFILKLYPSYSSAGSRQNGLLPLYSQHINL
jgi:hypothetical protein